MKKLISALKVKLKCLIKIALIKLLQFITSHPRLYKGPWSVIKRYFPWLHHICRKLLRRLNMIGAEVLVQRVRGGQEHALSPLAQRILTDLEASVRVRPKE